MTGKAELSEALERAVDTALLDLHVALPAVVASYDKGAQTVEVTPLVSCLVDNSGGTVTSEELPKLPPMPVSFPRSSDFFMAFPLKAGDTGLVIFSEASMDLWLGTPVVALDIQQPPADARRHTLSSGVFYPGLYNRTRRLSEASDTEMRLGQDGGRQLRFPPGAPAEVKRDGSTADFVSLAGRVDAYIADMDDILRTWVVAATDGGAALKTLFTSKFPTAPNSTASTSLKAEE